MLEFSITDEDRASWRNGVEVFFKMPKDTNSGKEMQRPEWNPYEYFDNARQPIYKLEELGQWYGINKCPPKVLECIENARKIAEIYDKYLNHALAVCLDFENKIK